MIVDLTKLTAAQVRGLEYQAELESDDGVTYTAQSIADAKVGAMASAYDATRGKVRGEKAMAAAFTLSESDQSEVIALIESKV